MEWLAGEWVTVYSPGVEARFALLNLMDHPFAYRRRRAAVGRRSASAAARRLRTPLPDERR